MSDAPVTSTLSRLLEAEYRCPTARLRQAMPYVSMADTSERRQIREIVDEDHEHQGWLIELMLKRGSGPPPASFPTESAGMHYVGLSSLLPGIVQAERALLGTYQSAAGALADDPEASRRVAQIMGRHSKHLATFEALSKNASSTSS